MIRLHIGVDAISDVLLQYDRIRVYRSNNHSGTYVEVTTATTRIPLVAGQTNYEFLDPTGLTTHWYRVTYYNPVGTLESGQSIPQLGRDPVFDEIMSVAELKDLYLFGLDLTNDQAVPFPDLIFSWGIRWAVSWLQRNLDMWLVPTVFTDERYDYYRQDYLAWTLIKLRQNPALSVEAVKVMWPSNTVVINFPVEWIQLRKDSGQVNIVPTSGTLSQVLLTAGGSFLPLLASGQDFVPNILSVDYTAGFAAGECPMELRELVGKAAALGSLHIAGDLIGGAGIASKSISIDGLSQSVSTTSSPTAAGYSSRTINYLREIKQQLPVMRRYYKGIQMTAV